MHRRTEAAIGSGIFLAAILLAYLLLRLLAWIFA